MEKTVRFLLFTLILLLSVCGADAQMILPAITDGTGKITPNSPELDEINVYLLQSPMENSDDEEQICTAEGCDSTFVYPRQLPPSKPAAAGDLVNFRTTDLNGIPVFSSEIFSQSKVTLFNLWSVTCSACIREMPALAKLSREYKAKGGQVVSLVYDAIEEDLIHEARAISQDLELPFLTILPNDDIYQLFPTQFFPVSYFINEDGKIIGNPVIGASPSVYGSHMEKYLKIQ